MINNDFKSSLNQFNLIASETQKQLSDLAAIISRGKVPAKVDLDVLDSQFKKLAQNYDTIVVIAKKDIIPEEMPPDGSSVTEYANAVEKSKSLIIRQHIERAKQVFTRFIRIRAKLAEYASALLPYQKIAEELLQNLSEMDFDNLKSEMEAPSAFLAAFDLDNIHSPEGFALLDQIKELYSEPVQWGLVGKQYYEDDSEYQTELNRLTDDVFIAEDTPLYSSEIQGELTKTKSSPIELFAEGKAGRCFTESPSNSECNIKSTDKPCEYLPLESSVNPTDNTTPEPCIQDLDSMFEKSPTENDFTGLVSIDTPIKENVEEHSPEDVKDNDFHPVEMLSPLNKIKTSNPSATSFKKDIIKLARIHWGIRTVLPLFSNLGVLTKEQTYLYSICMDCNEESDKAKNDIEKSIDVLVQKGFLAFFQFMDGDVKREVYCLTNYSFSCLKKEAIAVGMRDYWNVSIGKNRVLEGSEANKDIILNIYKQSDALLRYMYFEKERLSEEDFDILKGSIIFEKSRYTVVVLDEFDSIKCQFLLSGDELTTYDGNGAIVVDENGTLPKNINSNIETIFLFSGDSMTRFNQSNETMKLDDTQNKDSDGFPNRFEQSLIDNQEHNFQTGGQEQFEDDSSNRHHFSEMDVEEVKPSSVKLNDVADKTDIKESDAVIGGIDYRNFLDMKGAPSDSQFCQMIDDLANREVNTNDSLISTIVQSVLFSHSAGLEKNCTNAAMLSGQLKLATHLLNESAPYSSEYFTSVFTDLENDNPALLLSASLFAMFTPSTAYDFALINQFNSIFDDFELYFEKFSVFKPLFRDLLDVHKIWPTGFTPAAIALIGSDEESENFMEGLKKAAVSFFTVAPPKTRMKALPVLYSKCFDVGSDLHECLKIIAGNKQDKESLDLVTILLDEYCNKQDDVYILDMDKVEVHLTKEWDAACEKSSKTPFKLEYDAHDKAIRQFTSRLELILTWHEQVISLEDKQNNISKLRSLKRRILECCRSIQMDTTWRKEKYANVLSWVLLFFKVYLLGKLQKVHIYKELLVTDVFSLQDDGSPFIDASMANIRYYEPWRNALRHVLAEKRDLEEVKAEILGDNLDISDDSAGLKDNLNALKMIGKLLESDDEDYLISDAQQKEAIASADERMVRFKENLELAYTYNQINEIEKETLLGILNQYKPEFYEYLDFANWRRFLEALGKQVKEYAAGRKSGLRVALDTRLKNNPMSQILLEANKLLERDMNLAVAEEYMNRFDSGETNLDDGIEFLLNETDYFDDFLKKDTFDQLYQECKRNDGKALKSFGWNYVERHVPDNWTSRQKENSRILLSNWPSRRDTTSVDQVKTMFEKLGFNGVKASKQLNCKEEAFSVIVDSTPRSMADYLHPIAAFGTQLKAPINVVMLYGNYTEKQLVDTISSLDFRGITIVLLDRFLDASRRRFVGEIFHKQTSGQNPFLLIDRVLFCILLCTR